MKLTKLAMLFAAVAISGAAIAAPSTVKSTNWMGSVDNIPWTNSDHTQCWRNSNWTPADATSTCDGAIVPMAPMPPKVVAPMPVPVAKPAPAPVPPAPPAAVKVTYAADAFFDTNKAILKPEGKAKLDDLAGKVKGINLEVIIAVGHTDSTGKAAYNQGLSVRRAEAVKAYLVSKGIETNRVYTEGKGQTQPVADNKTKEGRAKNRRVEIEVVGTTK